MKKIVVAGIIIIAILVTGLFLIKNYIVKTALIKITEATTGLKLKIRGLKVGLFNTLVSVDDFVILNPSGFADEVMVNIPHLYVDYDLGAFFKKKVHLEELRLNLKELTIIKNSNGQLNLSALRFSGAKQEAQPAAAKTDTKQKLPEIVIDSLDLKIGKLIYKDYAGTKPKVKEFDVNIDESFKNITDLKQVMGSIIFKAISKSGLSGLAKLDLGPLQQETIQAVEEAKTSIKQAAQEAQEELRQIEQSASETVNKTAKDIKQLLEFK